jgi:hypothetical protein
MDVLPSSEQNRLIGAIEQAIGHTKAGLSPNDAIEKMARAEGYNPQFIDRMAQGFNKAKSVHHMKEASASDRHEPCELADAKAIISKIYSPQQKVASVECNIPRSLTDVDFTGHVEKSASLVERTSKTYNPELTAASYTRSLQAQSDFFGKLEKIAHTEQSTHKQKFVRSLETICDYCRPMTNRELQKTARKAVNAYPGVGDRMMNLVAHKIGRSIPQEALQKTASGNIFPAMEPFLSMQDAYQSAKAMADAEIWHTHISKEASGSANMLRTFLANAAAERVARPVKDILEYRPAASEADADELLDSNYFNKSKALEAKRALYDIMLTDDKFKDYSHGQVVGAWNALSKSHPKLLTQSPAAASTIMLQQLETGGRRDLHEIEQAQKVEKNIGDGNE